jgi:TPP-dependent pyruvate/acetoin dehydrogenase alpha subunit
MQPLTSLLRTMLTIRLVEEQVATMVADKEIKCPCHLYTGQEAIATGVCANLRKDDWVFSTHRSHGHYLAKGGNLNAMMAELLGKESGCSRGRGGSMHLADPAVGFPGSSAIVAGTIPLAVGAALAFKTQKKDSVAVAFFGDGAVSEGVFYESLNFASLMKLPVVFICENNLYSTHLHTSEVLANTHIHQMADAFNMRGVPIDGNDVKEVYRAANEAISSARKGGGPTLLECMTYRWLGHVGNHDDIDKGLRSQEELDSWKARCPIKQLEKEMLKSKEITNEGLSYIYYHVYADIEKAVEFARKSEYPSPLILKDGIFK